MRQTLLVVAVCFFAIGGILGLVDAKVEFPWVPFGLAAFAGSFLA